MRVGLTGGVASGKSTVAGLLAEHGALIIDGDALAHEVVQKGTPGLEQVVAEFGDDILTDDGDLDRPKLGSIVFNDESRRRDLEAIVHPLVFERIVEIESEADEDDLVVHDIPLLAESGRAPTFDAVIVVDAPEAVQIERMLSERGWTEDDARSRIASQASREDRKAIATHVVENSGTHRELADLVAAVVTDLMSSESQPEQKR